MLRTSVGRVAQRIETSERLLRDESTWPRYADESATRPVLPLSIPNGYLYSLFWVVSTLWMSLSFLSCKCTVLTLDDVRYTINVTDNFILTQCALELTQHTCWEIRPTLWLRLFTWGRLRCLLSCRFRWLCAGDVFTLSLYRCGHRI